MRAALLALLVATLTVGCENRTPPPPGPSPGPGDGESITGRERLGWDQQAATAAELATFRYAIYVDGARSEMTGVSCGSVAAAAGFACSGQLPPMSPGTHVLEIASFVTTGGSIIESPRSAPLRVTVRGQTPGDTPAGDWIGGPAGDTGDGVTLSTERLLDGFLEPADAAFSPDGRLFIVERPGRVTISRGSPMAASTALLAGDLPPGGGLLGIALDPDFARTRFVFILSASAGARGARVYQLSRYRELAGILAQRAVLLETPAPGHASGALRFGPDGLLYAAFGAGENPSSRSGDMGRVLRLRSDGTMPVDRRTSTPVISSGHGTVGGMAWGSGWLWTGDVRAGVARLAGISAQEGVPSIAWDFPESEPPLSLAVYDGAAMPALRGDLLVASAEARQILRVRFDPGDPSRVASTEVLLRDHAGPIRVVLTGPDGAVFFLTDHSLGRVRPGPETERR
jgi:aldose sugar dehydrogenase